MTRFEAAEPAERRKLFADAVVAHRDRASPFLTVEAEPTAAERESEDRTTPWVQFSEKTFNLDVGDEELERLESLLEDYPEFRIDQLESPEDVDGTNVRISARSDANRLAGFLDEVFQAVYGREEEYRAWVVEI